MNLRIHKYIATLLLLAALVVFSGVPIIAEAYRGEILATTYSPSFGKYRDGTYWAIFRGYGKIRFDEIGDRARNVTGNAYFQWGDSSTMNERTNSANVYSNAPQTIAKKVNDLDPNKYYYYRIVVRDPFGTKFGETIRFRIVDNSTDTVSTGGYGTFDTSMSINNYPAPESTTNIATIIDSTSVILSARANSKASVSTSGYFEWGEDISLGNSTPTKNLGALPQTDFSEALLNLKPGTTYYYRAVVLNPGGKTTGRILSFTTPGVGGSTVTQPPIVSKPVSQPPSTPIYTDPDDGANDNEVVVPKITLPDFLNFGRGDSDGNGSSSDENGGVESDEICEDNNKQTAGALFSGGFFPNTLLEWIIITILAFILVIVFLHMSNLYAQLKEAKKKNDNNNGDNGNGSNGG